MISQQVWLIIHERKSQGRTVSGIARELGVDRKTVRSALREAAWTPDHREPRGLTVLEPFKAWLAGRAAQVNYSARILCQELVGHHGFAGSYETVKLAARPLRAQVRAARPGLAREGTAALPSPVNRLALNRRKH